MDGEARVRWNKGRAEPLRTEKVATHVRGNTVNIMLRSVSVINQISDDGVEGQKLETGRVVV